MDGECDKEIRSRLAKGYAITTQLKNMGESWYKDGNKGKIIKSLGMASRHVWM